MKANLLLCIFISFQIIIDKESVGVILKEDNNSNSTSSFKVKDSERAYDEAIDVPSSKTVPVPKDATPDIFNFVIKYNYDFEFESAVANGINPDLSKNNWNITPATDSELQSSPGCPESYHGSPWVFYGNPVKCYLSGYSYGCPENMQMRPQQSSLYGYCDCNCQNFYSSSQTYPSRRFCLGKTSDGKDRILAYRKEIGSCQPLFQQGGCAEGEWFVFGDDPLVGPFCEKRRCPDSGFSKSLNTTDSLSYYDYRSESCHVVGEPCQSSYASWTTKFQFSVQDWVPVCMRLPVNSVASTFFVGPIDCPQGQKYSQVLNSCVPKSTVDADSVG